MIITQSYIIEAIITEAMSKPDQGLMNTLSGPHMVAVMNESNAGLCSRLRGFPRHQTWDPEPYSSVHGMLRNLEYQNTINASWGLAAVNSLLNKGITGPEIKIQELILDLGKNKNVAIMGHFPFVERMGQDFKNFWILELSPKANDIPEKLKHHILPLADLIAITATSLLNNSLGEILNLTRKNAVKILLGPSTPMAACLLDMGIDYLGGTLVRDHQKAFAGIEKGLPFRKLDGVSYAIMGKKHF